MDNNRHNSLRNGKMERLKAGVNGISELDMMRCMSDKVYKSVSKCTKENTNQSIEKTRVSE